MAYARRIKKVIEYIEDHLGEDLSLHQLSKLAGSSPYHFHRQFAAYSGITLNRLVRILRLRYAALQLA
jgi:AraC family transcriptional regulator